MLINESGRVSEVSPLHMMNAPLPTLIKSLGSVREVSPEHEWNAYFSIQVNESGRMRDLSPPHFLNALRPTLVKVSGSVREVRAWHFWNAWGPICCTPRGTTMSKISSVSPRMSTNTLPSIHNCEQKRFASITLLSLDFLS